MPYITHKELRNLIIATRDEARKFGGPQDHLSDLLSTITVLLDDTDNPTRFPLVEHLTDSVMNWYGFTEAWNYQLRPYAQFVAIELHTRRHTPAALTAEQIEEADKATGGNMRKMWDAVTNMNPPAKAVKEPQS